MNILLNSIIMAVYIMILFLIGLPNLADNNVLRQKLFLFLMVLWFQFVVLFAEKSVFGCHYTVGSILHNSFQTAIFAFIGFTIYKDVLISYQVSETVMSRYIYSTVYVVGAVLLMKIINLIFNNSYQQCYTYMIPIS